MTASRGITGVVVALAALAALAAATAIAPGPAAHAQGSGLATPAAGRAVAPPNAVREFRRSFEVSVDGKAWGPSRTVTLTAARCTPATATPCAPGTAPLVANVRFAAIPEAVDLSRVLAQIGEDGGRGNRYKVTPVPANAAGSVCAGGFSVPRPIATMRVAIYLGSPGTPLPVTCRWAVVAGVPSDASQSGIDVVWSDTVTIRVVAKP